MGCVNFCQNRPVKLTLCQSECVCVNHNICQCDENFEKTCVGYFAGCWLHGVVAVGTLQW